MDNMAQRFRHEELLETWYTQFFESALPHINRVEENHKVDFNGVLDMLPQIMTKSPIMIERLGIRPEYQSMEQGGNQCRGKNGSHGNRKLLSQEQASEMSRKVIARVLTNVGFEASSEVPMEVLSQLLSCHIGKLGRILKVLSDSYRKQCSAIELLKMFLQTAGYSNLGALAELVKDSMRNSVQQTHQQMQVIQSQIVTAAGAPSTTPASGILIFYGASLGVFLQWVIQVIVLWRRDYCMIPLSWMSILKDKDVHAFFSLLLPATINLALVHIASFTDLCFSSLILGATTGLSC